MKTISARRPATRREFIRSSAVLTGATVAGPLILSSPMILHRKITWDPKTETVSGDHEAAKMLSRPMRAPWDYQAPLKT